MQESLQPPPRWIGFVAGVVAGGSGVITGHAFDTMKVQAQAGEQYTAPSASLRNQGIVAQARSILLLYRGILPPLLSTGAMRSLYFGIYENVKSVLKTGDGTSLREVFTAGAVTGSLTSPVTSPFVVLKIRQQIEGGSMFQLVRRLGVAGLWRGLPLHCTLETIGSAVYLTTYSAAKHAVNYVESGDAHKENVDSLPLKANSSCPLLWLSRRPQSTMFHSSQVLCGALAGIMGWVTIYPLDVLRTRIMSGLTASPPEGSGLVLRAARECYQEGGLRAFHRGIVPTLFRAAPVAGVVLPVYDAVYAWLRRLTTAS